MSSYIDFYFDVISPYSYIAHKKIQKIKESQKVIFNYKPILLGGLHKLAEINAPAFNKYKMKNMQNDCDLISKKNNFDFTWNIKFPINSLYIMRGYLFIGGWIVKDSQKFYINKILVAIPLIITYLIGPIGLFLYWIIRIFYAKRMNLYE